MSENQNVVMSSVESIYIPVSYAELMFNIIQVVSKRGAILPNEFRAVGELHDFLFKELRIEERLKQQEEKKNLETINEN